MDTRFKVFKTLGLSLALLWLAPLASSAETLTVSVGNGDTWTQEFTPAMFAQYDSIELSVPSVKGKVSSIADIEVTAPVKTKVKILVSRAGGAPYALQFPNGKKLVDSLTVGGSSQNQDPRIKQLIALYGGFYTVEAIIARFNIDRNPPFTLAQILDFTFGPLTGSSGDYLTASAVFHENSCVGPATHTAKLQLVFPPESKQATASLTISARLNIIRPDGSGQALYKISDGGLAAFKNKAIMLYTLASTQGNNILGIVVWKKNTPVVTRTIPVTSYFEVGKYGRATRTVLPITRQKVTIERYTYGDDGDPTGNSACFTLNGHRQTANGY